MDLGNLHNLYRQARANAYKREITFVLTFKAWLDVWGDKILDHNRGTGRDRLRMERYDKARGYEPGNVYIGRPLKKGEAEILQAVLMRQEHDQPDGHA